jgi:hypothetical protein
MTISGKVSLAGIARVFDVTTRTVQNWRALGFPSTGTEHRPLFDVTECIKWREWYVWMVTVQRKGSRYHHRWTR